MPDNSLPDEIISEILSPALKVADDVFSDTSRKSPFANYSESTSAYLVVCKSWLRVATPLLYHVVVLRSKAQAKALARALTGNMDLGQFIKKLRVEGGFGPSMHDILKRAPNVSDLYLSFEIWTPDTTDGLCKGLQLISPTRLILRAAQKKPKNKMASSLVNAVKEAIVKWDRLVVFDCPYHYWEPEGDVFLQAVAQSERLHTILIPSPASANWAWGLLKGCPLQTIQIKGVVWNANSLPNDPTVTKLLKYTVENPYASKKDTSKDATIPDIAPSLNPSFIPLKGTSQEVQDAVWSRVLYFSMAVPERALAAGQMWRGQTDGFVSPTLAPLLVSKAFHRLGLSHYYAHVVLNRHGSTTRFTSILSHKPRIDTICGDYDLPWDTFETMVGCSGASLRECHIPVGSLGWLGQVRQEASPTIFDNLPELRRLTWNSGAGFAPPQSRISDGLPRLQELRTGVVNKSFFKLMSSMSLPSLQIVRLRYASECEQLLIAHGTKLRELEVPLSLVQSLQPKTLSLCPNLTVLSLELHTRDPPSTDILVSNKCLEKLALLLSYWSSKDKNVLSKWEEFFKLSTTFTPGLREIQMDCFEWPTTEREIMKSPWVTCAESLLVRNVNLTDSKGKKWRPRLKATRKR